ncbi:MAG: AIR synthase related protein [Actinomycetota bacterium]
MLISEGEIIAQLAEVFARPDSRIVVGIGDDAAVVTTTHRSVVTTDMAVEGVHFRRDWSSPFEIGRKITAANLADLCAMGATPDHLVVAVSLTGNESLEWIKELAIGIDQRISKVQRDSNWWRCCSGFTRNNFHYCNLEHRYSDLEQKSEIQFIFRRYQGGQQPVCIC